MSLEQHILWLRYCDKVKIHLQEAQQDNQQDLQITLQEVIDMIDILISIIQEEMMQSNAVQEETMQFNELP